MDHYQFDEEILSKGTAAILKTRDGKLRAAVPSPIGSCTFLNDVDAAEMNAALRRHKLLMREYPRNGEGLEAYVDASDTGYTESNQTETVATNIVAKKAGELNGNGHAGISNGTSNGITNGSNGVHYDGHLETNGANGVSKKVTNGDSVNGTTNGHTNGVHV